MQRSRSILWKRTGPLTLVMAAALVLSACGSSSTTAAVGSTTNSSSAAAATSSASAPASGGSSASSAPAGPSGVENTAADTQTLAPVPTGAKIGVALITKNSNNPFFIALNDAAKAEAAKDNVTLTLASGKADGDEDSQIQAIENSIARGDKGILITSNGPGIYPSLKKARDAGMFVIALDTPLEPSTTADFTIASDNFLAGTLIGQWAQKTLAGKPVTIAMLDLFNDKIVSVDHNRDTGFLTGMGINVPDKSKNGTEAPSGTFTGGGSYKIACHEPTTGSNDGGKTAMETCLAKDPNINVIYSINEPAGEGGSAALTAAGKTGVVVSIDGGCGGIANVKSGVLNATALQYPSRMASVGVDVIATIARGGPKPKVSPGLDFYNTGLTLVTDKPVAGVPSINTTEAAKVCWGPAA